MSNDNEKINTSWALLKEIRDLARKGKSDDEIIAYIEEYKRQNKTKRSWRYFTPLAIIRRLIDRDSIPKIVKDITTPIRARMAYCKELKE